MILTFVILPIILAQGGSIPKIHGAPIKHKCNSHKHFLKNGITMSSPNWPNPMYHLVVKKDNALHHCGSRLLCPELLRCDYANKKCLGKHPDWISRPEVVCPATGACLEQCYVSLSIHPEIILEEFFIWGASCIVLGGLTWMIFTELIHSP